MSALAVAFLTGLASNVIAIVVGRKFRLLDKPHGIKIHTAPVPFTGGLAYVIALTCWATVVAIPVPFLIAAIIVWAVGFADDVWKFGPAQKLALQVAALLVATPALEGNGVSRVTAVLLGVVLVNMFNILDGLDGLAGGVAFFALLPIALAGGPIGDIATLTAGFAAGFLLLNVNPARIFLGDQGSLALGFAIWFVSVSPVLSGPTPASVVSGMLLWTVPVVNSAFVIGRRIYEARPVLVGDRSHLYDVGYRHLGLRTTLAVAWMAAAIGGFLATVPYR